MYPIHRGRTPLYLTQDFLEACTLRELAMEMYLTLFSKDPNRPSRGEVPRQAKEYLYEKLKGLARATTRDFRSE